MDGKQDRRGEIVAMKTLLLIAGLCTIVPQAVGGENPAIRTQALPTLACGPFVHLDWYFPQSPAGFTPVSCDPTGGLPVWEWGPSTYIQSPFPNMWGTVLNGDYPNNSGQGLLSPPFQVTNEMHWLAITHAVLTEATYDGGNPKVNGQVLDLLGGYPGSVSMSPSYYAFCVDGQPGFTGEIMWQESCFDLHPYQGQTIQVEFDFGSDSSVTYPGWYIAGVRVEGDIPSTPVGSSTWGEIKSKYR
jgi:hypothetical protein